MELLLKSNVLIGSTHDIIETLETASNHALSLILEMEEKIVADKLYCPSSLGGGLLALEHHLLDVASVHNLAQGIFYMLPVKVGTQFIYKVTQNWNFFITIYHTFIIQN